ncbi:fibronectin type III domain-containing protein [Acidovorax sp. Root267]|uniref:fibronectin type III domain-containing protein n=1 Tax=Acidovorax sp. Root267 TaxID=1736505 RepID=UPI0009E9938F|nr:fibronectin type III domain-containing protein [Acidovorax sp. Root267]
MQRAFVKPAWTMALGISVLLMTGCGGGSGPSDTGTPPPPTVVVSPDPSAVPGSPAAPDTADTTAPSAPGAFTASSTSESISIGWLASTDNVGVIGYEIWRNGRRLQATPGDQTTFQDNGLTAGTTYTYAVRAVDAAGNFSAFGGNLNVSTLAPASPGDTAPPSAPTAPAASQVTATSLTLSWGASSDNTGVVRYEVYRNGTTLLGSTAQTFLVLTGLTASTTYSLTVKAFDAAGNASVASITVVVSTAAAPAKPVTPVTPVPDTTAPSVPAGLAASNVASTSLTVSWTASTDNVGVVAYKVYRDGALVGSTNVTSFTLTGLTASTSYAIAVRAVDAAANASAASAALNVSTGSATPPTGPTGGYPVSVIGPVEIISWAPATAYPGVPYRYRVGVIGGQAPYTYSVVTAPSGVTIAASTGELSWTAPASAASPVSIKLRATDSLGAAVDQTFSVQVTSSGFYFVSPTGNDSTGTGTLASPWKTISHALTKGATGDTLYVRGGSYTGGFDFVAGKITRIVGYPGDAMPAIDLNFTNINPRSSRTWVEGLEIFNFSHHGFHVDGSQSDLVFRRNHMHHLYDPSQSENPSFIFFADNQYYDRIIIQDNIFHDLFDRGSGLHGDTTANYHGGASVMYNVRSALVENNEVWAIDGPCFKDKDNGQRNTFRGNYFHDCASGAIHLASQYTQDRIEVSWNVLVGGVSIGQQPGYIRDIDIRHNTLLGSIEFGCVVGDPNSKNFIVRDNILVPDNFFAYASINCKFPDNTLDLSSQNKTLSAEGRFDYNLVDSSYAHVFGYGWYATNLDWSTWRTTYGKDAHSKKTTAQLTSVSLKDYRPKATSAACGAASDGRAMGALACAP